jgi:chemotaxis protein methyltransferase CheR
MLASGATPATLAVLSALVEEAAGLHYGGADRDVLQEKASARAGDAGFESLLDYYYFLRYDAAGAAELERLVEALVVGETYFFRELPPVELVADRLVPALLETGVRPRIWSAACATGEEPLTLAMLLDARGLLGEVDLVASDISARALARARAGRYGARALRDPAPPELVSRYLRRESDGGYAVSPRLIAAIDWRQVNLLDAARRREVGSADVILLRNVLIYFADATTVRVIDGLAAALRPGGALLVGVSESLLRLGTSLECEEHGNVFLYRKRT